MQVHHLPIHIGQKHSGVFKGPELIYQKVIKQCLAKKQICFEPLWHVNFINQSDSVYFQSYLSILESLTPEQFQIFLSADHSSAISSVGAMLDYYKDLGVIWIDAHGDLNTKKTSPTGNLHGMPLSVLLGLEKSFPFIKNYLSPEKLVLIGIRDLDEGEKKIIKDLNIRCYTAEDVERLGADQVIAEAIEYIGESPKFVSFDIDAMDPQIAPATGTPVANGLKLMDLKIMSEYIALQEDFVGCEIVELNPELASSEQEITQSLEVIDSFCEAILSEKVKTDFDFLKTKSFHCPVLFQ
ncbi:MAG: arginase [Bdellovibrionales bacterium]|nr:arginase [Bdellovibrionales bacterium]